MKKNHIAIALIAGVWAITPGLPAQTASKPSPYSGVSQPPPDETITTDVATAGSAAPASGLTARPAAPAAVSVPAALPAPAAAKWNPDYGIVGDPAPGTAPTVDATKPAPAAIKDPDADIVTFVPNRPGEIPEGTIIRMALGQELSTGQTHPGADFTGQVAADVLSAGRVVIPQGAQVLGKVVRVTEGRRFGAPATIRLRPDVVVLPDGSRYILKAQLLDSGSKARVDGEGTLKPASRLKTNVMKEGAGIGTGAVAGALIGGGPGALVGSLIGAGVMTTNILVQHPASVTVPKNSMLTLSLTQPMMITPVQTN